MAYTPNNPNGQATMANSAPVVIASDQSAVTVTANAGTNLNTSALALDATLANLGKEVDSVAGATDTGVVMLAKHSNEDTYLTTSDGDYDVLHVDSRGALHANPEQHLTFDTFNATTGWTALSDDTLNLATTTKHIQGTAALTFDKVNGAANTVFAGIQKTLSSINLGDTASHDLLQGSFYIPDISDVSYAFLRLGTDSSNYNEWRVPDTNITQATFLTASQSIGDANYAGITGNGWNSAAITYIAVGVAFDSQTNTLAGIVFDEVSYHTNLHTSASFSAEVTSDVNTPNINLNRVGGTATDTNTGTASNGTLRVTLATNVALPAGTNNIGDVDVLSLPKTSTNTTATVAGSATVVTLIASNASRCGATIYNDSTALLYVKLGSAASLTDFTALLSGNGSGIGGYYEVPFAYTGIITGIWASATGNARVGELT